jgi:ProP effector
MPTPTPAASPGQEAHRLLKSFQDKYPVFRQFKPLAIGIDRQLLAQDAGLDRKLLRLALGMHTHSSRYLKSMEKAVRRFNLDGSPADEVPEGHRRHAADILGERSRKETGRRQAEKEQEEQRKEREAQAAERQRMEKLNQLVQKFAKRPVDDGPS